MYSLYLERVRHRLTQAELAARAGVSRRTVIDLEKGERLPTLKVALRLCGAMGCSVEEVFRDALV